MTKSRIMKKIEILSYWTIFVFVFVSAILWKLASNGNENEISIQNSFWKSEDEFWVLVTFSFLLTSFQKLAKKITYDFFSISNAKKRKNAQKERLRFRFRSRQALALGHGLSSTKTDTYFPKNSVSVNFPFSIGCRV